LVSAALSDPTKITRYFVYSVSSAFTYKFYEIKAETIFDGFSKIGGVISFTGIITFIL
jgi:hypothetical protein